MGVNGGGDDLHEVELSNIHQGETSSQGTDLPFLDTNISNNNNVSSSSFSQPSGSGINNNNDNNERDRDNKEHVDVAEGVSAFQKLDADIASEARGAGGTTTEEAQQGGFNIREYFEDSVREHGAIGHKLKKMGLSVHDLTVVGQGADATTIDTNLSIFRWLWPGNWNPKRGTPFNILHNINAFCKDGEMLLVLGRPGAGCSTFLRMAANTSRRPYVEVRGQVTYGGLDASEFAKYGRGEGIYVPEEDVHYPTLTVEETMMFALKNKTPGSRLPEERHRDFRNKVFNTIMSMFGLTKQTQTMVGNEYMRGLSGGERKRMTIAEAMVARGTVECWDCSTRGLDAASAFDYAKSLRIMTDTLRKTTIASFYQASDNIYDLFDRVLILEKGRCIYFGPAKEAKQYFVDLGFDCEPRKSTPDFLTGVTNPQERIVRPGYNPPSNSAEFEEIWQRSEHKARAEQEQRQYDEEIRANDPVGDFREQVLLDKSKGTRSGSKYSATIREQVSALALRQWQVWFGDKFGLVTSYISIIVQALIYGSVFYQMTPDAIGLLTRGGALFAALLFNAFLAIGAFAGTFMGRSILQRHRAYGLYHPAAYHIAQVLLDIPIMGMQSLVFAIITYFMYGLHLQADKFFIFFFVLWLMALCSAELFRLIGNLSPSLYLSQQVLSLVLIMMLTYVGFAPTYQSMKPWFQWIHWANPFGYAFRALFTNEMKGQTFDCSTSSHIPAGPAYLDPAYRVCSLPGATPGATFVDGDAYLLATYQFDTNQRGLYVMALLLFWILYIFLNAITMEFLSWVSSGHTQHIYKRGKAPKQNDAAEEARNAEIVAKASENINTSLEMRAGVFMWNNINYTVPVPGGELQLLDNIGGWIKPGQMTALMGSSGAGKTTLLDVLAQRKTQGKVEGTMLLNGMPLRVDFERITGYVEQMDVHDPHLTVREALLFSAKLRQEAHVSLQEKEEYVERVLEMMDMASLGDALVGSLESGKGISVEERKRLTIGLELVAKPHILFLDEPTSGLDAQSSYNIVKFIRKLADAGMPLVCTIHQPSSVLFEYFDRLLLLGRGGKMIYFGDIGPHSRIMLDYFEKNGARPCTNEENPAEYILEAIGAGTHGATTQDWAQIWRESQEKIAMEVELNESAKVGDKSEPHKAIEFATSPFYQTLELYKRLNISFWRNPAYNASRIFNALLVGLAVGFSFWRQGNSTSDLQLIVFAIFQILVLGIMLINAALPEFMMLRTLFQRAYASKIYSSAPFSIALILTDLPYLLVAGSLCFVCCFFAVGFDNYNTPSNIAFFWIAFVLFLWYCNSFGQLIGSMAPNPFIAFLIMPVLTSILFLFCGVLSPPSAMPYFWRSWMYPLDPFRYFMEAIITNTLSGLTVQCTYADFYKFFAPPATTCASYTADFFAYGAPGYVEDLGNGLCGYCSFKSGREFYSVLGWDEANKDRNLGILMGYFVFNIIAASFFVYLFRKPKR